MKRLAYIDWMRGLACVLMFQTHCYDSWMSPEAKKSSSLIGWSRLGGTLPAPLFIFLAGVSFALVTEKLREKGIARNAIAKQTILRGAEIFGMGLLFRVQEFALGYPWSPWTDLRRDFSCFRTWRGEGKGWRSQRSAALGSPPATCRSCSIPRECGCTPFTTTGTAIRIFC